MGRHQPCARVVKGSRRNGSWGDARYRQVCDLPFIPQSCLRKALWHAGETCPPLEAQVSVESKHLQKVVKFSGATLELLEPADPSAWPVRPPFSVAAFLPAFCRGLSEGRPACSAPSCLHSPGDCLKESTLFLCTCTPTSRRNLSRPSKRLRCGSDHVCAVCVEGRIDACLCCCGVAMNDMHAMQDMRILLTW